MVAITCLVCGAREDEVSKMHSFPSNLERSRIWQEKLGFKYVGESLKNRRICSRHFPRDAYLDLISYKLRRDAVPNAFEDTPSTSQVRFPQTEATDSVVGSSVHSPGEDNVNSSTNPTPSTSTALQTPPHTPSSSIKEPVRRSTTARRKIIKDIRYMTGQDLTPRKQHLLKVLMQKENHLRKVKSLCKKRLHDMRGIANLADSNVARTVFQNLSSVTAKFMLSQIRTSKAKSSKGRRWTLDDKLLALCIFKRSPRCYTLLRKFFALPHKRTLLALLEKVPFNVGINPHLFKQLGEKLPEGLDRCCALLFDEIDIQENVQYSVGSDRIIGFEDFGSGIHCDSSKIANKALVFMLVGLIRNWKQPVAFYFNSNGCDSNRLQQCILEVLHAATLYGGVDVVATVCDMGVNNVKGLKELGVTIETPYFVFEERRVYCIYDPPHLLKCTFNLFRKHNVLLPCSVGNEEGKSIMEARFGDIRQAYSIDKRNPYVFRTMHKIKDTHMQPVMRFAMKVCVASQVLSHTTAAFLYSLVSLGALEQRAVATAEFVKAVDTLFDSFNGRTINAPPGKQLRCAVKEDSPHLSYWSQAVQNIHSWTFKRLLKDGSQKKSKPPSQLGWIVSLNAIQGIWAYLSSIGATTLRPRFLNQDPLENLFGSIRYGCGCSDNPNVTQFIGSLKTQILNGLTNEHCAATNCEDDEHMLLTNLQTFLNVTEDHEDLQEQQTSMIVDQAEQVVADEVLQEVSTGSVNILSVAYVAGFILKLLMKQLNCELCKSLLFGHDLELHNIYISHKEWQDDTNVLIYPSEIFTSAVGNAVTILEQYLDNCASQTNIMVNADIHLRNRVNFDWLLCDEHKDSIFSTTLKSICRIAIPWWCKRRTQKIKEDKKDKRSSTRKIKKFRHI